MIVFNVWMAPVARPFEEAVDALRDSSGMIVDLCGNPGGVLTMIMGLTMMFSALILGIAQSTPFQSQRGEGERAAVVAAARSE